MQRLLLHCLAVGTAAVFGVPAQAHDDDNRATARLSGFNEVPTLASHGTGRFSARLSSSAIHYELSYSGLDAPVTQAHIHIGQKHVSGGVMVFLCSNLGNGPAGTPACPSTGGSVSGTITAAGVVGPAAQDIDPGDLDNVLRAIRAGASYANVHTTKFTAGEIRGQVKVDD